MKIAFISQPGGHAYIPQQNGAIQIWIYEIARRIAAKSCDVIIYSARGAGQPAVERDQGVEYRRFSSTVDKWFSKPLRVFDILGLHPKRLPLYASKWWYWGYALQVALDLLKQACDIVHIMNFHQLVPFVRRFNPDVKIVLHMHCEWLSQHDPDTVGRRLKEVGFIVGCSEYITDTIKKDLPHVAQQTETVSNGVDVDFFSADFSVTPAPRKKEKQLLFIGRLSPEKGIHVLLDAFDKILRTHPDVRLNIIGTVSRANRDFIDPLHEDDMVSALEPFYHGSYLDHLKARITDLTKEKVKFLGFIPHHDILEHLLSADILVNPSIRETFGVSLVEAMATGTPVIASDIGGMKHIVIDDGSASTTGILVERGNVTALADAILKLLRDDDLGFRMGQAGIQRAREIYSFDSITDNMLRVYNELNVG